MANTINSANSVFLLAISPLFTTPVQIQGYMADAAFAQEGVDISENVLGVDGVMSYGWIPQMYPQTVSIMPSSPSSVIFETWSAAENTAREKFPATATITLKSTGRKYSLQNGVLTNYVPIPEAGKVLKGRPFKIVWNTILPAAM